VVREGGGVGASGDEELDLFECRYRFRPKRVLNPATQEFDVAPFLERALL
jgi:hypothetical protein